MTHRILTFRPNNLRKGGAQSLAPPQWPLRCFMEAVASTDQQEFSLHSLFSDTRPRHERSWGLYTPAGPLTPEKKAVPLGGSKCWPECVTALTSCNSYVSRKHLNGWRDLDASRQGQRRAMYIWPPQSSWYAYMPIQLLTRYCRVPTKEVQRLPWSSSLAYPRSIILCINWKKEKESRRNLRVTRTHCSPVRIMTARWHGRGYFWIPGWY